MKRFLKRAAVALVLLFAAAQLVRPGRSNPPTDPGRTIQASAATPSDQHEDSSRDAAFSARHLNHLRVGAAGGAAAAAGR